MPRLRTTISQARYEEFQALFRAVQATLKVADLLTARAQTIVDDHEENGITWDAVNNGTYTPAEVLKRLNVRVDR